MKEVIEEVGEEDSDDEIDATEDTAMIQGKPATIFGQNTKPGEKRKSGGKRHSEYKPKCLSKKLKTDLLISLNIPGKGDSPIVTSVLEDVKRIKVSPPKAGKLYPNLSDIEATTETETENQTRSPSPDNNSRCDKITNWILFCFCLA